MSSGAGNTGALRGASQGIQQLMQLLLIKRQEQQEQERRQTDTQLRRELLEFQQEQAASQAKFQAQQLQAGLAQSKAEQDLERRRFELEQRVTEAKLAAFLRDAQAAEDKANGGDGGDGKGTPVVFGGPKPIDANTGTVGNVVHGAQQGLAQLGQGFGLDIANLAASQGMTPEDIARSTNAELITNLGLGLAEQTGAQGAAEGVNRAVTGPVESLLGFGEGELTDIAGQALGSLIPLDTEARDFLPVESPVQTILQSTATKRPEKIKRLMKFYNETEEQIVSRFGDQLGA